MKTYLGIPLVACLLASVLLTSGCKTQSEYDQLQAQGRNANAELARTQEALAALRGQYETLKGEYDRLKAESDRKDGVIAELTKARQELLALVDKLRGKQGEVVVAPPPQLPLSLDRALEELATRYGWIYKNGMVKLSSDLTFDPGSDDVVAEAAAGLKEFAQVMNTPEAARYNVYIAGHTDDIPINKPETKRIHPTNWYLSVHRAVSVEGIIQNAGVSPERMAAVGFGEFQPVEANAAGHKGNKLNRRVEIWILPPERFLTVTGGTLSEGSGVADAATAAPAAAKAVAAPKAPAKTAAPE